ncbi:MAG: hypothetical protein J0M12_11190 [Deltaproteobacteria bacterium]|nr:hypothetical protein [Deltaproteobacteria bacterium]
MLRPVAFVLSAVFSLTLPLSLALACTGGEISPCRECLDLIAVTRLDGSSEVLVVKVSVLSKREVGAEEFPSHLQVTSQEQGIFEYPLDNCGTKEILKLQASPESMVKLQEIDLANRRLVLMLRSQEASPAHTTTPDIRIRPISVQHHGSEVREVLFSIPILSDIQFAQCDTILVSESLDAQAEVRKTEWGVLTDVFEAQDGRQKMSVTLGPDKSMSSGAVPVITIRKSASGTLPPIPSRVLENCLKGTRDSKEK